jgi:hypothetical protein
MSGPTGCPFCGFELTVLRRKTGRIAKCRQCAWQSPMLPPTPRPKLTAEEKAIKRLRYPRAAVRLTYRMGVSL